MNLVKRKTKEYLTLEDGIYDSRVPVRSDEEFRNGIRFAVKLIGISIIPKPRTRNEIVTAMRTVRSEGRRQKTKKTAVELFVSFDGIRITGKDNFAVISHPLNRIFYVSHDSLDLHVFSLIVREENTFKCVVFKASKKTLAVNAVRTIGQAFELCQKLNGTLNRSVKSGAAITDSLGEHHHNNNNSINTSTLDAKHRGGRRTSSIDGNGDNNNNNTIVKPAQDNGDNGGDDDYGNDGVDGGDDDDTSKVKQQLARKCSSTATSVSTIEDGIDLSRSELRTLLSSVTGKLDDMTARIRALEAQLSRLSTPPTTMPKMMNDVDLCPASKVTVKITDADEHDDCSEPKSCVEKYQISNFENSNYETIVPRKLQNGHKFVYDVSEHVFGADSIDIDNRLNEQLRANHHFYDKSFLVPESILTPTPILPASKLLYLGDIY